MGEIITPLSVRGRVPVEDADVAVRWSGTGEMTVQVAPGVPPERVLMAAGILTRVANKMLDAADMKQWRDQQDLAEVMKNGGRPT